MSKQTSSSVARKLLQVMEDCTHIPKEGTNAHFKYKYVRSEDLMAILSPSLQAHGLVTAMIGVEVVSQQERMKPNGVDCLVVVRVQIQIIDPESGESITIAGLGAGLDGGDKAVAKATTQAVKYAWMATLSATTGDDPEADPYPDREQTKADRPNGKTSKSTLLEQVRVEVKRLAWPPGPFMDILMREYNVQGLSELKESSLEKLLNDMRSGRLVPPKPVEA